MNRAASQQNVFRRHRGRLRALTLPFLCIALVLALGAGPARLHAQGTTTGAGTAAKNPGGLGNFNETSVSSSGISLHTPGAMEAPSELAPSQSTGSAPASTGPDMTGGQGISLDGRTAEQRLLDEENQDARDAQLGLGKPEKDPQRTSVVEPGKRTPTSQDQPLSMEYEWLDKAVLAKGPLEAPDRLKFTAKGRTSVFTLYFVTSADAGKPDSRRTRQMAGALMVKPEAAAEYYTKVCEEVRGWVDNAKEVRIATRWEKVSPLKDDSDIFAFVFLDDRNLAEMLVESGYASCNQGKRVPGPHDERPSEILGKLLPLEQKARSDGLGAWGLNLSPQSTQFVPPNR